MRFYPFAFTGKERDEETGYGYLPRQARQAHHGARYMDHELMTMWLSVDRYADKYPFISPYAYCAWNPVKLTDPSGDTIIFKDKKAEEMFEKTYNDISVKLIKFRNKKRLSKKKQEEYIALSKIKQSMDDVKNSKTKFYYSSLPNDGSIKSEGHTYWKEGVDGVSVDITEECYGTLVHETKHASQFVSGDWEVDKGSVDEEGHFGLINYDLQDEFDAYRQEFNYLFYINHEEYYDDNRIKTEFVNGYKDKPYIIREYIQYNASNPKTNKNEE
jgi:RHS repeat-associated protein